MTEVLDIFKWALMKEGLQKDDVNIIEAKMNRGEYKYQMKSLYR